jgi:hypothetical protein
MLRRCFSLTERLAKLDSDSDSIDFASNSLKLSTINQDSRALGKFLDIALEPLQS